MTNQTIPLILEPDQLQAILDSENILIVDVCRSGVYERIHVPRAVHVDPSELVCGLHPAPGKLPSDEKLNNLFSRIGYSSDKHIIAYDDEGGGWAGRFLWTLDLIGHKHYSYLNGGLHAWNNEGHSVTSEMISMTPSDIKITVNHNLVASLDDVMEQIHDENTIVWDARSAEEYLGMRGDALRRGHIPGAVNLDWLDTMDPENNYRLLPLETLRQKLETIGITQDKNVITHCQTHHRSGLTYLVGKALSLNIKAYDGSWSEWGNSHDTPIET